MPAPPQPSRTRKRVRDGIMDQGVCPNKSRKSIACQRCHTFKVKCSGSTPCERCHDAGLAEECTYPRRDRQIKVSSQFVERILEENERLRSQDSTPIPGPETSSTRAQDEETSRSSEGEETAQNPLLEDRPWFLPLASLDMPIHISEAADAAFATRFRQTLDKVDTKHIPRMNYVTDEHILGLSDLHCPWPTPARARFLVKVALNTVCSYFHIVRKSAILETLEVAIQRQGDGERLHISRLFIVFALGELYSTKVSATQSSFPGLQYFAKARRMVCVPAERPRLDTLEIVLLLVIYSFALNRRHSAYSFSSTAVRLGTIMGMHLNIPSHQFPDRAARQHRTRLWWTAYTFDRMCASKIGQPPCISDDDIQVDLPCDSDLDKKDQGDFLDAQYIIQHSTLARLSAQTIRSIYSRRRHEIPFSQRVQSALKNLTKWVESLPPYLQLDRDSSKRVTQLQLLILHTRFNQCVILTTRPILLHVLRNHIDAKTPGVSNTQRNLPDSALALAETCIQCARHTYRLLTDAWIQGSYAMFDYFNTQYLFSSAIILAISSLLDSARSRSDSECHDNAFDILQQLQQSGNFCAGEYYQHLRAISETIAKVTKHANAEQMTGPPVLQRPDPGSSMGYADMASAMTAGMALAEPTLQEFLSGPGFDLQLYEPNSLEDLQTPYWPELWGDGWSIS